MIGQFEKRNFDLDMDFYLHTMIKKTAFKFISDPSHILHGCHMTKRFLLSNAESSTSRFWTALFHLLSVL